MKAQEKNQETNTEEDSDEEDRDDMDYFAEMSNLAKSDEDRPTKNDPTEKKVTIENPQNEIKHPQWKRRTKMKM